MNPSKAEIEMTSKLILQNREIKALEKTIQEQKEKIEGLESEIHLYRRLDKVTTVRIKDEGNAFYQECFRANSEKIDKLQAQNEKYRIALEQAVKIIDEHGYIDISWFPL